jgi:hypothetical protein
MMATNLSPRAKNILMKKLILLALLFSTLFSKAQVNFNSVINTINSSLGSGLSNQEITQGLKEALNVGSKNATDKASQLDGFYKNNLIKIPFPKEAKEMRSTLLKMGMKKQVEDFEKQLNRAAEDASKKAAPIFLSAVTKMTINDGITILRGKDDEATQYLKKTTTSNLTREFKPIISTSLQKVQITKYWKPLISTYNKLPFVKKMNPNLDDYVTGKATEGLFILVAQEETKIRKDPSARVSDILKKVFGGK